MYSPEELIRGYFFAPGDHSWIAMLKHRHELNIFFLKKIMVVIKIMKDMWSQPYGQTGGEN